MQTVTVSGTNLFALAAATLGDATQWIRIAQLNRLADPMIYGVATLLIPDPLPTGTGGISAQWTVLRAPRVQILADDVALPGVLAVEVAANNHFGATLWSARLALSADPAGLAAWDDRADALIDIQLSCGGGWSSLVQGRIDRIAADPVQGLILIDGRDLAAGLIEARTSETFTNQTASEVASLLAARHDLTAQVVATTTPIGRYYGNSHERLTLDRHSRASTEWDLLAWLARQEGYDMFVSGTTLYFQPQANPGAPVLVLQAAPGGGLPANLTALRLQRALTLAGAVEVTVKSWNSQQQLALSQTASRPGPGVARKYMFVQPNLTAGDALTLATRKLEALVAHQYVMTATMPGELQLSPRDAVALGGTGSSFDQTYVIDQLDRRFDVRQGFVQTLRARAAGSS